MGDVETMSSSKETAEIITMVAYKAKITEDAARIAMKTYIDAIMDILNKKGKIRVKLLGLFRVIIIPEHKAKDPRTGKAVFAHEKRVVRFRPGTILKRKIQEGDDV
jgi:DNA-binding protein HU-beta